MLNLRLDQPRTEAEFIARDKLLQDELRPKECPFSIRDEYPLVLDEVFSMRSLCAFHEKRIVGHLNLMIRESFNTASETYAKLMLVGNVVTAKDVRGQGVMRYLFNEVERKAKSDGVAALILWSELPLLYQKMGFRAFGSELRIHYSAQTRTQKTDHYEIYSQVDSLDQLETLTRIREQIGPSIRRNSVEFWNLLGIPGTVIKLLYWKEELVGYAVLGRGWDMLGIVHEWACAPRHIDGLKRVFSELAKELELDEILVLAPNQIRDNEKWKGMTSDVRLIEEHSIGFIKPLQENSIVAQLESSVFFWGLDSI